MGIMKVLFNTILFFYFFCLALSANTQNIELQLKWKHQFQFAGYYMAKENGYYADVGLNVNIKEFDKNHLSVDQMEKTEGYYGIGYPSVLLDKANGTKIALLSAIYQISPHILITLHSSGINSIKDFKNKTIMVSNDAVKTVSFIAMMKANNIDINSMHIKKPTFKIDSLINGETDIITAYLSNEPYVLNQKNIKYTIWNPEDYGFDFYDDILFTSQKELDNHPKRVDNFLKASLKGWEYTFSHIQETIDVILKKIQFTKQKQKSSFIRSKYIKKISL
jgi:polar amino acid transport system substrate-binding protein